MLNKKIYLCGIGAQKAGTTFIAKYLSKHPDFCMSPLKELHYFNTQYKDDYKGSFEKKLLSDTNIIMEKFNNGEDINATLLIALIKRIEAAKKNNYKSYFNYFVQKHHIAFGEITPAYSILTHKEYKVITQIFPNHKFLFLLRNPVDRFWSQINYELKGSDIDPLTLIDEKLKDSAYILRTDYKRTIQELLKITNEENIFIAFYEDIFSENGGDIIQELSSFLSIEYRKDLLDFDHKINKTAYKSEIDKETRLKIAQYFKDIYEYIKEKYNIPTIWEEDYMMIK